MGEKITLMSDSKYAISDLIQAYFKERSKFNGDGLLKYWQPQGKLFLVGNQGNFRIVTIEEQTDHMKEVRTAMPDFKISFKLDEIEQIKVYDDLIASVHVRYRMLLPAGYGQHRCFFNLAKIEGKWKIVNTVDRGIEVLPDDLR